jgi:hypothetical protein
MVRAFGGQALARIGSGAARERELRAEAAADAVDLYRTHGAGAVELLTERIMRPDSSAADRRRDRLARLEVERLDRAARNGSSSNALVPWKPPLFSLAGLAGLFGLRSGPRRRRR